MTYVEQSLGDNHYRAQFPAVRSWFAWAFFGTGLPLAITCFLFQHDLLGTLAFLCGALSLVDILYRP